MGRIRTVRPEFPHSESIGRISRDARLLFILTWGIADDSGRLRGNSRMLASLLFPYDADASKLLPAWLKELEGEGLVRSYSVNGDSYIDIPKFLNHQKIDKPSASKLPAFDEGSTNTQISLEINSLGREGKGREASIVRFSSDEIESVYEQYPRKVAKKEALAAIEKALKRLEGPDQVSYLVQVTQEFARSPAGQNGSYTPHPATWYNRSSYLDDPREWQKVGHYGN